MLGEGARSRYANTLLCFAAKPAAPGAAFARSDTKERIGRIMCPKKNSRGVLVLSAAAVLFLAACSLTEPAAVPAGGAESELTGTDFAADAVSVETGGSAAGGVSPQQRAEHEAAGIDIRRDGWHLANKRIHRLWDGVANITIYQHLDGDGVVDVRVIRTETELADGSITELRKTDSPVSQEDPGVRTCLGEDGSLITEKAAESAGGSPAGRVSPAEDGAVFVKDTGEIRPGRTG